MKLLVIGASGGIGFELVNLALEQGHQVTALSRNVDRATYPRGEPEVISGDILDPGSVKRAVKGQDAVCTAIGIMPTFREVRVFSDGIKNVLGQMNNAGVRRLVAVTGIGAGESEGHGGFLYDRMVRPLLLKTIYEDKNREEEIIATSATEWTIVRPGFLTNGPLTGEYRVITDLEGVTAGKISRKDTAHFILKELDSGAYIHRRPLLTS